MRKPFVVIFALALMLLNACNAIAIVPPAAAPAVQPTSVDDEVATRVSRILTAAATQNIKVELPTSEGAKGEIGGEETTPEPSPTAIPTEAPTNTPLPTHTPLPTSTPLPTETPTQTATPLSTLWANITPMPTSDQDPRNRQGPPTSGDALDNANQWNWPTGYDKYTSADWRDGSMRVTALTSTAGWRLPTIGPFQDIYIEMTARPEACAGLDNYGLFYRVPDLRNPNQGYWFAVSCDGLYRLAKWDGYNPDSSRRYTAIINWTASSYIRRGPGQPNRLGVLLRGDTMTIYANGYQLASYRDTTFPVFMSGHFGVVVNAKNNTRFTADIDEMAFWVNPQ